MTDHCITFEEVSLYWKRFSKLADRRAYQKSPHADLLRALSKQRFHKYPGELNRGLWEIGPTDFSKPCVCQFDYTKLTTLKISLQNVTEILPGTLQVVPGNSPLTSHEISKTLNDKSSKLRFGIFNYKHEALSPNVPKWVYENSIVHQVNSRGCSTCPEWLPLDNYIQLATAWTHSDFHIDKGNTAAYVGMIEGEKLVLMILDREGLHNHYSAWFRARFSESNTKSFWYVGELDNVTVIVARIKAGELLYIPPGCVHFVLTLKSSITISGNFFHKNFIKSIAGCTTGF